MGAVLIFFVLAFASFAFGQEPAPGGVVVPGVDPLFALIELIKNWKTVAPLAAGMTLVASFVQVLKLLPDWKYHRLAVTVLSVLYSSLWYYSEGGTVVNVLIMALVTGGGAVAIYEAIKGLWKPIETLKGK